MPKAYYKHMLEIACFNLESCIVAQANGADRIEFCASYESGGITPSYEDVLKARKLLHIPLHIIIRPRGGNFVYTTEELNQMKSDILFCKENKIDGIVFGILNSENHIDVATCKEFLTIAGEMSTTFHRAIDACIDIKKSINELINLGFTNVLTSGGFANAETGVQQIKALQNDFGKTISIIPGGGIRSNNINYIKNETDCYVFHSAAILHSSNLIDPQEITFFKKSIC